MIILNNNKFALTDNEFNQSLLSDKTCSGFYMFKYGVVWLYTHTKTLCGVISKNSILASATRLDDGRIWYSYANVSPVGLYQSYSESCAEVEAVRLALLKKSNTDKLSGFFKENKEVLH